MSIRPTKTVGEYLFGGGALDGLDGIVDQRRHGADDHVVMLCDHFFRGRDLVDCLPRRDGDQLIFVDTTDEPTTDAVDELVDEIRSRSDHLPVAVVGIGGGTTLDSAKAVSNLLTNGGRAADYQGWDLVREPGVFKIGVPTLSGTGAEASRTCVMMNHAKNLKLGMNSDHTVFDRLVLDPDLTATVPRDQYFFTGLDTYIHCIESRAGRYRHGLADAFSREALALASQVFLSDDMQSADNREKLMLASYLGGSAIGNSLVGVVHPFSAGLSMTFHIHHCLANCIVMNVMEDFYPAETEEFHRMVAHHGIEIPRGVCADAGDDDFDTLYQATIVHDKPLANALGDDFSDTLTRSRVGEIFRRM